MSPQSPVPVLHHKYYIQQLSLLYVSYPLATTHHMDIKYGPAVDPELLWRADNVTQGKSVIESSSLGEVEVSVIDVMVDGYEDLPLTCVYHTVMLHTYH